MSQRYEWARADETPLELVGPGTELGDDRVEAGHHALILGDPWASAYVVEGPAEQLHALIRRAAGLLPPARPARRPLRALLRRTRRTNP